MQNVNIKSKKDFFSFLYTRENYLLDLIKAPFKELTYTIFVALYAPLYNVEWVSEIRIRMDFRYNNSLQTAQFLDTFLKCMKSKLKKVWISDKFGFQEFGFQTFTVTTEVLGLLFPSYTSMLIMTSLPVLNLILYKRDLPC